MWKGRDCSAWPVHAAIYSETCKHCYEISRSTPRPRSAHGLVLALDRAAARGPGLLRAGPSWSQHGRGGRRGSKLMSNDDIEFL